MSTFAERQLAKFGWKKGQGLGKNEDGVSTAVKVEQKQDSAGIGLKQERSVDHSFQWWDHAFNKAIGNIQVISNDVDEGKADNAGEICIKRTKELKRSDIVSYRRPIKQQSVDENGFTRHHSDIEYEEVLESTSKMTDAELFKACGGRTAHKGARSSMNGKLHRAQQIGLGLPSIAPSDISDESDKDDEKAERKRSRREKRRLEKEQRKLAKKKDKKKKKKQKSKDVL